MSDRRLVIAELDPADANHGKLYGLSADVASAIKIPAFTFGPAKPVVGTEVGEAFYETTSKKGWVWDGTAWREIAASPLKTFATEALLTADTAEPIGTYGIATNTGGLFVRRPSGWGYVGVKPYATAAALLADNTQAAGTLGEASDENTLWERTATGWRLLVVREMADTVAVQAWGAAAAGANPGDRVTDLAHSVTYIRTSAGWKPTTLWEETEANIRAATWVLNGQEAVATDTGRTFVRVAGAWVEEPIQHYATDALLKAATPADGTLAWADDTAAVYARAAGKWVGMNTGFSDPLPIGAISAFPTHTMPAGWLVCDGAAIPAGADYDALRAVLGGTTVPNLLGQFLRGSSTAVDALLAKVAWTTGMPKAPFTTASAGDHTHTYTSSFTSPVGGGSYQVGYNAQAATSGSAGAHTHTISGGDTETAPDHVRIVWGIKARYATVVPASALVVHTTTPKKGDVLTYDPATSTWKNQPAGGGSITGLVPMPAANKWFRLFTGIPDASGLYRVEIEPGDSGVGGAVTFELLVVKGNANRYKLIEAWPTTIGQVQNIDNVGAAGDAGNTTQVKAHTTALAGQAGRPLRVTVRALDGADVSGFVFGGGDDAAPDATEQLAVPELFPAPALSYPRLMANKTIEHHTYGANNWEETTMAIADISRWIPTGHLYKLELDARLFAYHGGNAYLKTYFSGTALYGNTSAQGDQVSVLSSVQTPHAGYSRHITGVNTTGGALTIHFCSTTSASNGDRQIFGEVLLWDLGVDADLPSLV